MGWVYNLKDQNAPTTAPRLIAICMTFSAFALLAVALRFHMRLQTEKGLWVDDYTSLFSAVSTKAFIQWAWRILSND